jgi:hypothetical protein
VAILEALSVLGLAKMSDTIEVKRKLARVSAMLTRLIRSHTRHRD